jgi:hypothetical protein
VFEVAISDVEFSLRYRDQETEERQERSQSRFDRLSQELPGKNSEEE